MIRPDPAALTHLMAALLRIARKAAGEALLQDDGEISGLLADISHRWSKAIEITSFADSALRTPLSLLKERLGLTPLAVDALLLSLSTRVEPAFAQVWERALHAPGAARDGMSIPLALDLLIDDPVERLEALRHLDPDSALSRWRLLEPVGPRAELRAASRLVRFLMGDEGVEATLAPRVVSANPRPASLGSQGLIADVERLAGLLGQGGAGGVVVLQGDDGAGRKHAAEALAAHMGRAAIYVDLWGATSAGALPMEQLPLVLREAALLAAPLIVDAGGPEGDLPSMRALLTPLLRDAPVPVMVLNRHLRLADVAASRARMWVLQVPRLDVDGQRQLWRDHLADKIAPGVDLDAQADRFDMSASQIASAARMAAALADARSQSEGVVTHDLQRGSVEVFTHQLGGLAWRLPHSEMAWDDLVIGKDVRRQLGMMISYMRNRRTVYDSWGMKRFLSGGRGVKALFYGPPGTGKTLAASVMARELGLDVYQVDLSQIVSKWVGETEKNLDRVLTAAENSQVILLFDEADALFGGRGDVKSATDRYANMEVNYLLQRFDHYDGAVILTSNLVENLDKAFARRLHFLVEFPFPDEAQREQLWRRMLAGDLPVAADVDCVELARRFELAGGNIRNAVLTAAFLAAEEGKTVTYLHVLQALSWEMQKQGMVPSRSAFGEHWSRLD